MKKRIICAMILVLCLVSILIGCTATATTDTKPAQASDSSQQEKVVAGMEYLGRSGASNMWFYYYRDTITDVIYVWGRDQAGYAGMGGLTVMLDPETGLPLTLARWKELYNEINNPTE